jgi:phospholipase/lecithinase/hemolysin
MNRKNRRLAIKFTSAAAALALFAGCSTSPQQTAQTGVKRIVVFGDSNVDNGNLYRMTSSEFPAAPRWKGRDSNGPVVVEYLSESLNATLENYAVSGATTGESNIVPQIVPKYGNVTTTGVIWQLAEFTKAGGKLGPSDVVVLWAGSNDIFGAKRQDKADLTRRIDTASSNVERALLRLHALGAKRVVFSTRTPRDVIGNDNDLNGVDLNAALLDTIRRVRAKTGLDIVVYDAYARISDMMTNPSKYGFTDPKTLCVSVPACASDAYGSGQAIANTYVNWDGAHKTTRVHKIMATEIQDMLRR